MAQQFDLKFDKDGLIPAIVVDSISKKVLTLAYMNEQSLEISLEKGLTCFFSRSRQQLWLKGETSGNYQHIVSIITDCDRDALLVTVEKDGPACHTGSESCFTGKIYQSDSLSEFSLRGLYELLEGRKKDKPEGSYTTYLFEKGIDKILKKVGRGVHRGHHRPPKPATKRKPSTSLPTLPIMPWSSWLKWASRWTTSTKSLLQGTL